MPATTLLEPDTKPRLVCPPWKRIGTYLLYAVAGLLIWEFYDVFLGDNFHTVVPGKIYRGAQPAPEDLESLKKNHGIRTVVNLRGLCNGLDWYHDQVRVVQRLEMNQEDICFSAGRIPPAQELRRFVKVLDEGEYPMFLHCRRGSDRTGIACAVIALLQENSKLADARRALHWRYGHLAVGRPGYLDQFLDFYEDWLKEREKTHTPAVFRDWVRNDYHGGWCMYEVEEFQRLQPPGPVAKDVAIGYRVKLRNTGSRTWNFATHGRSGYHLGFRVREASGMPVLEGKGTMLDRDLAPGASLATTLYIPAKLPPGRYRVMIDMLEEHHGWFFQLGAEPVEEELVIRE